MRFAIIGQVDNGDVSSYRFVLEGAILTDLSTFRSEIRLVKEADFRCKPGVESISSLFMIHSAWWCQNEDRRLTEPQV
jgi:hypothetical protein